MKPSDQAGFEFLIGYSVFITVAIVLIGLAKFIEKYRKSRSKYLEPL